MTNDDPQDRKDIIMLMDTLKHASKNGLLYEVLTGIFPEPLENLSRRCFEALYEWDL